MIFSTFKVQCAACGHSFSTPWLSDFTGVYNHYTGRFYTSILPLIFQALAAVAGIVAALLFILDYKDVWTWIRFAFTASYYGF